jgi:hypothetical protein
MVRSCRLVAFAEAALLFSLSSTRADDSAVIGRWYAALLVADRTEISDLLANDIRIKLDDLGIVQGKQEFIASMDEWQAPSRVPRSDRKDRRRRCHGDRLL